MTKSVFTKKYKFFREQLIHAREVAGLNQRELAVKLGRPQSFVSKYERGERRLDLIEFLEVTDVLCINPANFIDKIKDI